jgi:L-fuconolactonase
MGHERRDAGKAMTRRIDAHQHFWRYVPENFGWIGDTMAELRRDFLPSDLETETRAAGIDGVVSVQARQSLEETSWLLALAEQWPLLEGVVGWLPLADDDFPARLEQFSARPKLKGLRHVIQDEPDEQYILRPDFNRGISALQATQLVYDILIFDRHLPQTIQFVDRHPQQVFVLDHIGKPRIREGDLDPWRSHITELAKRTNVYCKISGMVTEASWQTWSTENLSPYLEIVLEAFGPKRLMMGSDWPVCLLATTYSRWLEVVQTLVGRLSAREQQRILGETATEVYRLAPSGQL